MVTFIKSQTIPRQKESHLSW